MRTSSKFKIFSVMKAEGIPSAHLRGTRFDSQISRPLTGMQFTPKTLLRSPSSEAEVFLGVDPFAQPISQNGTAPPSTPLKDEVPVDIMKFMPQNLITPLRDKMRASSPKRSSRNPFKMIVHRPSSPKRSSPNLLERRMNIDPASFLKRNLPSFSERKINIDPASSRKRSPPSLLECKFNFKSASYRKRSAYIETHNSFKMRWNRDTSPKPTSLSKSPSRLEDRMSASLALPPRPTSLTKYPNPFKTNLDLSGVQEKTPEVVKSSDKTPKRKRYWTNFEADFTVEEYKKFKKSPLVRPKLQSKIKYNTTPTGISALIQFKGQQDAPKLELAVFENEERNALKKARHQAQTLISMGLYPFTESENDSDYEDTNQQESDMFSEEFGPLETELFDSNQENSNEKKRKHELGSEDDSMEHKKVKFGDLPEGEFKVTCDIKKPK